MDEFIALSLSILSGVIVSLVTLWPMPGNSPDSSRDGYTIPVTGDALRFKVKMALLKAGRFCPRRRTSGDHDRLKLVSAGIVGHLELCGIACFRGPPGRTQGVPPAEPRARHDARTEERGAGGD